ncbi:MAG TPA: cytochrome C oxidase subunit II [Bacillus sp. (in: firmicutes)]|uniref:cytochrome C oxidase subunit II n=1 Tax=Bacillus litorisediminis TaxID=2922713 RepID=UPI001FACD293|nr:cytochrome C oxidase subunit II [Bacillus litorisediminis]HWO76759.1 cytochrome C oxidase subunit II [Bacillus sp. (in: firmicutes)]
MKKVFALIVSMMVLFLTACGGDKEGSSSELADQQLNIVAENWAFDQEEYKISSGEVSIILENKSGLHGIQIQETGDSIEAGTPKTLNLEPGTYTLVCNIMCGTGHTEMKSTLIVE